MRNWIIGLTVLCFVSCGKNDNGPNGPSTANAPGVVMLTAPSTNATRVSVTPNLTWTAGSGGTPSQYYVKISANSSFTSPVVDDSTGGTASYAVASALSNQTKYYWEVAARNTGGTSAYKVDSFTTIFAIPGTVWKIVAAMSERITISQNSKDTVGNLYGDSASIAHQGTEFGYLNFLSFLTSDTLKIYGNMDTNHFKGTYTVLDSTISSVIATSDTTALHLGFVLDQYNQLLLDFPAVEVHYYAPAMGMVHTQTFNSIQERNDYIATLDTSYHAGSLDSLVYTTTEYYYIKQ